MKKGLLIVLIGCFFGFSAIGQMDSLKVERNHGLTVKKLFPDYLGPYTGDVLDFRQYGDGFEIGYVNRIIEEFEVYVPFRVGVVEFSDSVGQSRIFSLGAQGQYFFKKEYSTFSPYALAGINIVSEDGNGFHADVPIGLGLDINVHPSAAINLQASYNFGLSELQRSSVNLAIGFKHYFIPKTEEKDTTTVEVPKDSDKDGIVDELDLCPNEAGPKELMGCPDSDGDGISDVKDKCPKFAGLKEFDGCPDTDGDGLSDNEDECPKLKGPKENNGCPDVDADDDGIVDAKDDCPDEAGPVATRGCPDTDDDGVADHLDRCPDEPGLPSDEGCPDTDNDGIIDPDDLCPNSKGPARNKGCPEIKKEEKEVLDLAMEAVQFETGKATLKTSSFEILDQIVSILKKYPDYNLRISGHTDNTGSAELNQRLSERRARSCYEYLASRGISTKRMSYVGYGESKPRASNNSESGRRQNRRVEFDLYLEK